MYPNPSPAQASVGVTFLTDSTNPWFLKISGRYFVKFHLSGSIKGGGGAPVYTALYNLSGLCFLNRNVKPNDPRTISTQL